MNPPTHRNGMSWSARLLIALLLVLSGAAAAVWGLARSESAARFLGVAAVSAPVPAQRVLPAAATGQPAPLPNAVAPVDPRIADLQARLARVENATQRTEGSVGRADALVVAFAARRAIDRGVALGYLEPLLVDRFGTQHQRAVGTIIAASHQPVRLSDLIAEYETLGPELRRGGPQDSWWTNFKRELGTLVEIHRASQPSANADARYNQAVQRLNAGNVEQALAETMRLPGAARASAWVAKARRYIAAHRALDEVESSALLVGSAAPR
jgi:hypothetical protein